MRNNIKKIDRTNDKAIFALHRIAFFFSDNTHAHTRTHTRAQARTHARTHADKHTHTQLTHAVSTPREEGTFVLEALRKRVGKRE